MDFQDGHYVTDVVITATVNYRNSSKGRCQNTLTRGGETSPNTLAVRLGSTYYQPVCNNATFRFYLLPACMPWRVLTSGFYLLPSLSLFFLFCYYFLLLFFATSFATFCCHFHAPSCVAPIISTCDLCSEMPCAR